MTETNPPSELQARPRATRSMLVWDILLIGILLLGAIFRITGLEWDQGTHMHPDERFLTMVATSIQPVDSLSEYFDTAQSSLNPHNRGYGFYVYGTLPMFIVRYAGEWLSQVGYDEIDLVGRQLSAVFDLGTVLLVYLIAVRLYGRPRLALLASFFYACSVLPIQLSHFFKEDTFMTFFATLTAYFAVRLLPDGTGETPLSEAELVRGVDWVRTRWREVIPYVLFGVALGMATASKINAAPLAVLLPGAVLIRYLKIPAAERDKYLLLLLRNLVVAAFFALLAFRVFQPYAFEGPGFFGLRLNEKWLANMRELASQNSGDVDFPPQLQWARRPVWFGLQNMVLWGMGAPLGVLAWGGFLWMGWKILRGGWAKNLLLWAWVGAYFVWQSSSATPSMRYFMPIYPILAIIASWTVFSLWEAGQASLAQVKWHKVAAWVIGLGVAGATLAYAFAFLQVYIRPFTRVEASRWIYQNVPGPINLHVESSAGEHVQMLPFTFGTTLLPDSPTRVAFTARTSGSLESLNFPYVTDEAANPQISSLVVIVYDPADAASPLAYGAATDLFSAQGDPRGKAYEVAFDQPVELVKGRQYFIDLQMGGPGAELKLYDIPTLKIRTGETFVRQALPEAVNLLRPGDIYTAYFEADSTGTLQRVFLPHVVDWEAGPEQKTLTLSVWDRLNDQEISRAAVNSAFLPGADYRGEGYWFDLQTPVTLAKGASYVLKLEFSQGAGALAVYGSKQAIESSWDDALPLSIDGYSPYDINNGVFRSELNFEMYWDDNADKLDRFETNLDTADYIFISSNRQWGTTVRVPERYPLTTQYYRSLLGCPADKDIVWCYAVAEPGMFTGELGFELIKVVQSDPNLGSVRFNTQFAEEAFTVYDSPKVLIFKKSAGYDSAKMRAVLESVDLTQVVHLTPAQADKYPGNLLLPQDRLARQQAGGTWAELFNRFRLWNRLPGVGAVLWYLAISLLGWLMYPFVRLALRGLPDKGYPFLRIIGMILLAYPVWLAGSAGVPFSRLTIGLAVLGLAALNAALAWWQRKEIADDLRRNWRYFLAVEGIALAFFAAFLLVRLGNSDLWHQWKGGEKPMDFSYFNAVLKSTTFPPYDPWFAGGYINYYYYGFVLVGVPVKLLGIMPSIAYNLILPQLFSLLALGAFSVLWNLLAAGRRALAGEGEDEEGPARPYFGALTGSLFIVVLGNLGSLRMIWHGLMKLSAPDGAFAAGNILQKLTWTFQGLAHYIGGTPLPYAPGDWYWIPSRAFPNEPITEFPAFTFLYADMHAHMIALPVTVLVIGWGLSLLLGRWEWQGPGKAGKWLHFAASFLLGGLAIGTLRPTNTWDFPTYLALGVVALVYTVMAHADVSRLRWDLPDWLKRTLLAGACTLLLAAIALITYQPFAHWFGQGYNAIDPWKGDHTPWWSYITHWGLFFFMIISWLVWETRDWMATTPVSSLNKLRRYRDIIYLAVAALILGVVALLALKVSIGWFTLPLAAWAGVLLLRPGTPPARRAVLFLIGTGLVLTLMVELIVLRGDLGRMNTVFKFYLQAWTLLSLSAAAALAWVFPAVESEWKAAWRNGWSVAAAILVGSAALFPLLAGADKIRDRMSPFTPHTLDGMTYMAYSTYNENGVDMNLSADYRAIRWMQDNIKGSPVIVEGHTTEYRWGNRFTINTGLPGVVGWNWHQRQQRALTPETWVTDRVQAVADFYSTYDREQVVAFLRKYNVSYIIVGVLEHAIYPMDGLGKFEAWNNDLWTAVYRDGDTVIYQVNR